MKTAIKTLTLSVAVSGGLFVYNNMTALEQTIQDVVKESQALQLQIDDPQFSPPARSFLIDHKRVVSNFLAAKTLAKSCSELFAYDRTLLTGKYILYSQGNIEKPVLFKCITDNNTLVSGTYLKALDKKRNGVSAHRPRFNRTVTLLNNSASGSSRINIKGVRGMPKIIEKLSTARCKMNVDYGFDDNGVWVKNHCSAKFKVPLIMPLSDRSITSAAPNLNPVLGHVGLPEIEGTNVAISGWACEKDMPTAVNVQLYMGGPAGVGTFVRSTLANKESTPAINARCDTTGAGISSAHNFRFVVPASKVRYRRLYVHAVSSASTGTSNGSLKGSRGRIIPASPRSFPGSNQCGTVDCSLEDPRDKQPAPSWSRYLINNDDASIDRRCVELGYAYGEATEFYTHAEWCHYSNARTKYWDGVKWVFGSCRETNVKRAVCH